MSKSGLTCGLACSSVFGIVALLGIAIAIAFPVAIFPALLRSQIPLQADSDGQLSQTTFFWSQPPITNNFAFYFFNVTNQDEVTYYGAKPDLQQVGPYTFLETENKRNLSWDGAANTVWYQNYKTWTFNESRSCPTCKYSDYVTIPNAAFFAVIGKMEDPQYHVTAITKLILQLGLLALGEYPIRTVPVRGVLFEGYEDPLISILNSDLLKTLDDTFNNGSSILPFPVPKLRRMGYFVDYNNSADEDYWINTGKDNTDKFGKIRNWANMSELPWWPPGPARAINGSDGSLNPPFMKKTDTVYQFNSFMCRSLYLTFETTTQYKSIPTYRFTAPDSVYDTTLPENEGFRYTNTENVNYYPNYRSQFVGNGNCQNNNSCLLPPGLYPIRCFPGKNQDSPFAALFSPPHFYSAPPEVVKSVNGLNPIKDLHQPAAFDIEPTSGTPMEARFRIQVSFPLYPAPNVIVLKHVKPVIIPAIWLESHVSINDNAYNTAFFTFVVLAKLVLGLGVGIALFAALLIVLCLFCAFRARKQSSRKRTGGGGRGNAWQDYVSTNDNQPAVVNPHREYDGVAASSSGEPNNYQDEKF